MVGWCKIASRPFNPKTPEPMPYTLENKYVTTRMEHDCFGCCRPFPAGTRMHYLVQVDGGILGTFYTCRDCKALEDEVDVWQYDDMLMEGWALEFTIENENSNE